MAATTRSEIVDIIKRRFGGVAGDTTIVQSVNKAVRSAEHWLVPTTDSSTITFDEDDYDYSLPSDLVKLLQVWTRDDTDEAWVEVSPYQYRVTGTPGAEVLYFDTTDGIDDGDTIRLEYLARLSELSASNSTLGIGEPMEDRVINYIVEYALYDLYSREAAKGATTDAFQGYSKMAQACYQQAMNILRSAFTSRPAGRVHAAFPARSLG